MADCERVNDKGDSHQIEKAVNVTTEATFSGGDGFPGCDRAGAKDYAAFLGFFSLELP
jgi:hypothetical protein